MFAALKNICKSELNLLIAYSIIIFGKNIGIFFYFIVKKRLRKMEPRKKIQIFLSNWGYIINKNSVHF